MANHFKFLHTGRTGVSDFMFMLFVDQSGTRKNNNISDQPITNLEDKRPFQNGRRYKRALSLV